MTMTKAAGSHVIASKTVTCPHCGGTDFTEKKVLLNTRGATFFNVDWLNRDAQVLTCVGCGRLEWFAGDNR